MKTTATAYIGGEEFVLKPLVFAQMKKIWPFLAAHMTPEPVPSGDTSEGISADQNARLSDAMNVEMKAAEDAIKIIAIALRDPEKDAEWIENHLTPGEMPKLQVTIMDLLEISGMIQPGNAAEELEKMASQFQDPAQTASTETSTD